MRRIRKFTTLLPPGLLFTFCFAALPLSWIAKLRGYCYPWISPRDHWKKKVIETYDHYHPHYQEYTDPDVVERWFREEGCEVRRTPFGSFVGRKNNR